MWRSGLFAFKWSRMGEKPILSLRVQFQCFKFGCEKLLTLCGFCSAFPAAPENYV